jgi:hypothetical protein
MTEHLRGDNHRLRAKITKLLGRHLEDSDHGMRRYLAGSKAHGDFLGIMTPDEDSLPCVERHWRLPEFEDEIGEVCGRAWLRLGETVREALRWLGANPPSLSLDCRHASQEAHFKLYSRETLTKWIAEIGEAK